MRKRMIAMFAVAGAALSMLMVPGTSSADVVVGEHVFQIAGESTVSDFFEYVQAAPFECDRSTTAPISDPALCRAAFGIPKPALNAAKKPYEAVPGSTVCDIARNLGPLGPNFAGNKYVSCAGSLTHTTHLGPHGCNEVTNAVDAVKVPFNPSELAEPCSFTGGSTWFYGFCGQTYGGAENILFRFGGSDHVIKRMGFTRPGAGVWEFNGILTKGSAAGATDGYVKLYLSAIPNPLDPGRAAACEQLMPNIEKVWWQGTAIVSDSPLLLTGTIAAKKPGWHWCDGTTAEGC